MCYIQILYLKVCFNLAWATCPRAPASVNSQCSCYVYLCWSHFSTTYLQYLYCPSLDSTPYLLPMSSQYTISSVHVQSVYHLFYLCTVRILLLLITSKNPILLPMSSQSVHYYSCPSLFSPPSHLVMSRAEYHLSLPCPDSTLY